MLEELEAAGLPLQLSWLPLIESGFKVKAYSRARALGLWQFIPSTGYRYGLKRDLWIDERMDPLKSTRAAIEYLSDLHGLFGDWATALAAYNCGEGNVLRAIRAQKINYLDDFWDLYLHLPSETARYLPKFLATLAILDDPQSYGITLPEPDPPLYFKSVRVEKPARLSDIAKAYEIPLAALTGTLSFWPG
ncbi:lytic transglycosylase domain-containing protein [Thermodesulfobacteriota bacterium]